MDLLARGADNKRDAYLETLRAGLRLPPAQQIAIQHKGQIKIESKPDRGTAVWLWLPMYLSLVTIQLPEVRRTCKE
ncbi:MAG: ATP-binding protein [Chloroflexi bacterium]|nr:ATP-binding protein [Chloroflexota bacterium]